MRRRSQALLLALVPAACAAPARPGEGLPPAPGADPAAAALAGRPLPPRWDTLPTWDFERLVLDLGGGPWSEGARLTLGLALLPDDQRSVRAAVLLARGGPNSAEVLLAHLERRESEVERWDDAAEVVAAAALNPFLDEGRAARLAELACGERPHPDLEVRVECAAQALSVGRDSVVPFLLRVLHAGTPAELHDPIDWPPQSTLAWAKGRAAEALALRAGLPDRFDPDASWASQQAVADALEEALAAPR